MSPTERPVRHTRPDRPGGPPAGAPPREFEVLRLAARAALGPARARAFGEAVARPIDWDRVVSLGAHHRVLPLLYAHLRDHGEGSAPEDLVGALRANARRTAADVLFISQEMGRVGTALDEAGVPYLVLKGPTLAEAYGGVAKRPFSDNDLLVRRPDFGEVERVLLGLGFNERKRSGRQQAGYLSVYGEYTFGRAEGPFVSTVDVHTRLVPFGFAYHPDFDALRARAGTLAVGGLGVPVLSWEDLFLALSVNALKDQWTRLRLATDLAEIAPFVSDWDGLRERARGHGCARALHLAVLLAADLVGGEFPAGVLEESRADGRARRLADVVRTTIPTLELGDTLPWGVRTRLNLVVQDGVAGMARYLSYALARRTLEGVLDPRR